MIWPVNALKDEHTVKAGRAIRSAREAKGWSQTDLRDRLRDAFRREAQAGEESTVGQSSVSKWEKGANAPEAWKWRVIEDVLGMESGTLARLLLGTDDLPPPAVDQLNARLDTIEETLTAQAAAMAKQASTMTAILKAVREADRPPRGRGT